MEFMSGLWGFTLLQRHMSLVSAQRGAINDRCEMVYDRVLPASDVFGGEKNQLSLQSCESIDVTGNKPCPDHIIPASHMHTAPAFSCRQTVALSIGPQVFHCQE